MVYMVYDGDGLLACLTQDYLMARRVLSRLCLEEVFSPRMEVYPERAFALVPEADHE